MPPALGTLFGTPSDSWLANKLFWVLVVGFGLVLPLLCLRNLDALKYTSALGLLTVVRAVVEK
jgi:amino acid permease